MDVAKNAYFFFGHGQTTPDSHSLVYLNILIGALCCIFLAYGNREFIPGYYWPFIAFCIYKIMYCSSEVLEATMIILHKVPLLRIEHQADATHFILFIGSIMIIILFIWAYFLDIVLRARHFMQEELISSQLPCLRSTLLTATTQQENASQGCIQTRWCL